MLCGVCLHIYLGFIKVFFGQQGGGGGGILDIDSKQQDWKDRFVICLYNTLYFTCHLSRPYHMTDVTLHIADRRLHLPKFSWNVFSLKLKSCTATQFCVQDKIVMKETFFSSPMATSAFAIWFSNEYSMLLLSWDQE